MSGLIHSDGKLIARRSFLVGIATSLLATPAIVRAASIMPVKQMLDPFEQIGWFAENDGSVWTITWEKRIAAVELLRNDPVTAAKLFDNPPILEGAL